MKPKKKSPPRARSLQLIEEERVNVERCTRERIALLFPVTETSQDKATQTEIAMREVNVEVIEWAWLSKFILLLFVVIVH
jgi:hypothetical protein